MTRVAGRTPRPADRHAIVIGASAAGVFASAALALNGWRVTLVERDRLPAGPEHRRGVPQDRQAHVLLHRGLTAIEGLLPGFRAELLARDGVPFDTGRMPWLSAEGWLSTEFPGREIVSATRPLIDAVARDLLRRRPEVRVRDGLRVNGLAPVDGGWRVTAQPDGANRTTEVDAEAAPERRAGAPTQPVGEVAGKDLDESLTAAVVVDASGRGSRLEHWLPDLPGSTVDQVDARVGYAARLHVATGPPPLDTGLVIFGKPPDGASGLALPVEGGRWMVSATGMGASRPPRDVAGFERFIRELRDPALADLVSRLEPIGDVAVHRQTENRRRGWGRSSAWPAGLLVVGDALCAFDPIYGQGITVAALQAERLRDALAAGRPVDRSLQRALRTVTDVPWSVSTGNDLTYPSCPQRPTPLQRLSGVYSSRLGRRAAAGDRRAATTYSEIYHLMAPASALLHPALLAAAVRPSPRRRLPRPAVLDQLTGSPRSPRRPPEDRAGA